MAASSETSRQPTNVEHQAVIENTWFQTKGNFSPMSGSSEIQSVEGKRGGGRWTKEEDDKLIHAVQLFDAKNWKKVVFYY